jgi:hypothetical protein
MLHPVCLRRVTESTRIWRRVRGSGQIHAGDTARRSYWRLRVGVTVLVALAYCVMVFRYAS